MSAPASSLPAPAPLSRVAGWLYLVIIVCGLYAELVVRTPLLRGHAAATASNIVASLAAFRSAFAADLLMAVSDVGLAVLLYVLLRPIDRTLALLTLAFRLMQAAVLAFNLLHHFMAGFVVTDPALAGVFEPAQLEVAARSLLDLHAHGYDLALYFFGVNCIVLGVLFLRSRIVPRALGASMAVAGVVYLAGTTIRFLWPAGVEPFAPAYAIPAAAELALCGWLIVRGLPSGR